MNQEKISIDINPGRLLFGLSRIGYTTTSALCDIIDNAIRAKAKNIKIAIIKDDINYADSRRNNVKEYLVIDDGEGMNSSQIKEALKLGASDINYEDQSLAKFGLGLKSATFSQGDILEVISSDKPENSFSKYQVDIREVIKEKKYFATKKNLDKADLKIIDEYLKGGRGTIIRLGAVRKGNHPSVKSTLKELTKKLGVIYFYFLKDNDVSILIENLKIEAIDPLFVSEAEENGNLNEHDWGGKTVRWIEKETLLTLDDEEEISVKIEMTQLPHPPTFKLEGQGKDKEVRDKYLIESGNYGFYVYRNKRLISWATSLEGIVPQDQDYYSFRGRIFIDNTADDYFNIDVKKANITLSDEAWSTISDFVKEGKRKSKSAWGNAKRNIAQLLGKESEEISNLLVEDFDQPDILPGDEYAVSGNEINIREEFIKKQMSKKVEEMGKLIDDDNITEADIRNFTPEEVKKMAITGKIDSTNKKIFRVTSVIDNNLWEPYYDTDMGICVRINKLHRFSRLIYEDNKDNKGLHIIFDLLLLQLAEAEIYARKNIPHDIEIVTQNIGEYRRICSEYLANLARRKDDMLPPKIIGY